MHYQKVKVYNQIDSIPRHITVLQNKVWENCFKKLQISFNLDRLMSANKNSNTKPYAHIHNSVFM